MNKFVHSNTMTKLDSEHYHRISTLSARRVFRVAFSQKMTVFVYSRNNNIIPPYYNQLYHAIQKYNENIEYLVAALAKDNNPNLKDVNLQGLL